MNAAGRVAGSAETIDVYPPARGPVTAAAKVLADVGLALLLVLMLPFVLVIGAPLALLAWGIVVMVQSARTAR